LSEELKYGVAVPDGSDAVKSSDAFICDYLLLTQVFYT
jgi:hypothetical protein